jgi:hypothetical protein
MSKKKMQDKIKLNEFKKQELIAQDHKCILVKCKISDLTEQIIIAKRQIEAAEQQRGNLFDELYKGQTEYNEKLAAIAQEYKIDDQWMFSFVDMEFNKKT